MGETREAGRPGEAEADRNPVAATGMEKTASGAGIVRSCSGLGGGPPAGGRTGEECSGGSRKFRTGASWPSSGSQWPAGGTGKVAREQSPGPGRGQAGTGGKGQGRRGDGTCSPEGRFWVWSWRPLAVKRAGGRPRCSWVTPRAGGPPGLMGLRRQGNCDLGPEGGAQGEQPEGEGLGGERALGHGHRTEALHASLGWCGRHRAGGQAQTERLQSCDT